MSIRVTQQTMYNKMVGGMQSNLGAYMESIEQGSSQKKVNRPSDDPAGTYRILTTRVDMTNTAQYQENVDTANGWLNLADDILSRQVTTAITGLKTLAEQASTGTYTAEQRKMMADQARQYFGQLLNLANTEFEGKQLFAGHKYDQSAFQMGLGVTTWDDELTDEQKDAGGGITWAEMVKDGQISVNPTAPTDKSILVQFTADATGKPFEAGSVLQGGETFRWSDDGGVTWHGDGEDAGKYKVEYNQATEQYDLNADGVIISINKYKKNYEGAYLDAEGRPLPEGGAPVENRVPIKTHEPEKGASANNGTTLYLRPAAFYQGDDKDPPAQITVMGNKFLAESEKGDASLIRAEGTFGKNVAVRIDAIDLEKGTIQYSYSTDSGSNWVTPLTARINKDDNGDITGTRLPVPGGYMEIDGEVIPDLTEKTQIQIHPSRSDLKYEIMKDTFLEVNSVGKDVFGGWYEGKPVMDDQDNNLFEVVGSFIGYLEGNNQEGCQKTLAALTKAENTVLAEATRIGGMENRLEMAADVLSFQKIDQQERLSYVEDIDLTELLTKLTRQQIAYQTVLQSSSMIMNMSLANYI